VHDLSLIADARDGGRYLCLLSPRAKIDAT
jgi:hypothetical protein